MEFFLKDEKEIDKLKKKLSMKKYSKFFKQKDENNFVFISKNNNKIGLLKIDKQKMSIKIELFPINIENDDFTLLDDADCFFTCFSDIVFGLKINFKPKNNYNQNSLSNWMK